MGQSPPSNVYNADARGLPFYQGNADFGTRHPKTRIWCDAPTKIAHAGDILLSVRAPIGALNIATETCCIGRGLAGLTANPQKIDALYLYYMLQSKTHILSALGTGSTFKAVSKAIVSEFPISIYPLEKQKHIASVLDTIERAIDNIHQQLNRLDELVKSQFVEMFGDPVTNPMGWERARLADKCEIVTGNTPSRKVKEYYGKDLEWIKSDNITEATTLTEATEYLSDEGAKVGRTVETGSILMTCIAGSLRSIGNVAIVDRKVAFNQQINAIVPKKQNTYFMYEQFRLSKDYICSGINMALKGILSKGQLSEIEFVFPPLTLQNEFAAFVEQVDKSELLLRQLLEKQQTLKKALMQEYFS